MSPFFLKQSEYFLSVLWIWLSSHRFRYSSIPFATSKSPLVTLLWYESVLMEKSRCSSLWYWYIGKLNFIIYASSFLKCSCVYFIISFNILDIFSGLLLCPLAIITLFTMSISFLCSSSIIDTPVLYLSSHSIILLIKIFRYLSVWTLLSMFRAGSRK